MRVTAVLASSTSQHSSSFCTMTHILLRNTTLLFNWHDIKQSGMIQRFRIILQNIVTLGRIDELTERLSMSRHKTDVVFYLSVLGFRFAPPTQCSISLFLSLINIYSFSLPTVWTWKYKTPCGSRRRARSSGRRIIQYLAVLHRR
jgi:hypothetical protein